VGEVEKGGGGCGKRKEEGREGRGGRGGGGGGKQ